METESTQLDEVMVVAYGTAKKESYTGAATSVKTEKLEALKTTNISKALEGLSSGVMTTSGSGQPGEASAIRIRGFGSINASQAPLYVVDGFPFFGDINSLPTNDLENVTVLKDAAATALYGSRAANGVIVITTKKGKKDKNEIKFQANLGYSQRSMPEYDKVSVPQYYELAWEYIYNTQMALPGAVDATARSYASNNLIDRLGGYNAYNVANTAVVGNDGKINPTANLLYNDNWYDEMHRMGKRQEYSVSASGGNEKTTYFLSANYLKDQGIVEASDYNRYTIRLNVDSKMREWLKVGMNMSASASDQNFPNSTGTSYVNTFFWSRNIAPIYPVYLYDLSGNAVLDGNGNKQFDWGNSFGRARTFSANSNPLGVIKLDTRQITNDNIAGRGYTEFSFLKDFKFTVNASVDYNNYASMIHQNSKYGDAESFAGRSTKTDNRQINFSSNQLLTWNKTIDRS